MDVTVAIVTYNRPTYLDQLLNSLRSQTRLPETVIVVDNGTDERTRAVVTSHEQQFEHSGMKLCWHSREDRNLPAGRNVAIERTTTDIISFLDDDTVATSVWLEAICQGFENDVAAVGGPALAVDESLTPTVEIETASTNQNHINRYGETANASRKWIPPHPVRTDFIQGANMSFDVETLRSIGGFDTGYRGYPLFEETDVMARLKQHGETILYHPDALVYHVQESGDDSDYWYWHARNALYFRRQNFSENYFQSILRLLFWKEYHPEPLWKHVAAALSGDEKSITHVRGFLRGIVDGVISD